ncbi:thioredoxin [Basidiobolus meristosporus CBS 931.73]|uniref:Thioredoxin n=1 Tax=Basidiobolus meristosporus CBS 931.73 TaxID=1314790 RepID=A0A1Y1Z1A2_9FUNG|nr:thioredoxin [Basidiobolus meristosporus CBS 931.73]|eukprot:ORY03605.1 thioredoxin [Basidiobolus meristosporus CBS 931.73]
MLNHIELQSDEQYAQLFTESKGKILVLNFWASWAAPCAQMNEVFAELASKCPNLLFIKVEAENFPDISEDYEIAAVPSFVFVQDGKILTRVEGANAPELSQTVENYTKSLSLTNFTSSNGKPAEPEPKEDITVRLGQLIQQAPVMLFMKGEPAQPRCGFSRQLIEILRKNHVRFGYFDILSDEEVRQGLKEYSNWPTYPQLYVNGELVGGLDIVKELIETDEFTSMIPAEAIFAQ